MKNHFRVREKRRENKLFLEFPLNFLRKTRKICDRKAIFFLCILRFRRHNYGENAPKRTNSFNCFNFSCLNVKIERRWKWKFQRFAWQKKKIARNVKNNIFDLQRKRKKYLTKRKTGNSRLGKKFPVGSKEKWIFNMMCLNIRRFCMDCKGLLRN